ncbi:DUF1223 domain-containing protein [Primorskyibacter sp. S87]|uniref:DUF1223 domain-containing protein n=1 Tax=Primorskyibacter sp. S87 TaxID=3415126 RepID=UPI003C7DFCDD
MKRHAVLLSLFCLIAAPAVVSGPARAGDAPVSGPVVIELFTSQGCSSCPPADALMHKLAKRPELLPLALHVDYWDYIGWKDVFADPGHTVRQKAYAHSGGRNMIYTPQMVINGQEDVVGVDSGKLSGLVDAHLSREPVVTVTGQRGPDGITLNLTPVGSADKGRAELYLVRYTPLRSVSITRGELAGHDLKYANVVESWETVGSWDGQGEQNFSIPLDGDQPAAILVQRPGHGEILGAARFE